MTAQKYNGWTNYATWNIKLWIDNEQGTQEWWAEQAMTALDITPAGTKQLSEATMVLEDVLETHYNEELMEAPLNHGWMRDLMQHTLANVNWYEIAECFVDAAMEKDAKRESHNERGGVA
jgi:hypothetical protein|tara:strand:+ start:6277 stop:6636 length:360 start_codon:yes stop_codon:yes gene_type:complete